MPSQSRRRASNSRCSFASGIGHPQPRPTQVIRAAARFAMYIIRILCLQSNVAWMSPALSQSSCVPPMGGLPGPVGFHALRRRPEPRAPCSHAKLRRRRGVSGGPAAPDVHLLWPPSAELSSAWVHRKMSQIMTMIDCTLLLSRTAIARGCFAGITSRTHGSPHKGARSVRAFFRSQVSCDATGTPRRTAWTEDHFAPRRRTRGTFRPTEGHLKQNAFPCLPSAEGSALCTL